MYYSFGPKITEKLQWILLNLNTFTVQCINCGSTDTSVLLMWVYGTNLNINVTMKRTCEKEL